MTTINKLLMKKIRHELEAPLKEAGDKLGVTMELGKSATFDPNMGTANFKLNVAADGEDGEKTTAAMAAFKAYATLEGLEPEDLGKSVMINRAPHTIVGYNPKARKNKIIIRSAAGNDYVIGVAPVKRELDKQRESSGK